jgi:hypothetical protein
MIDAVVTTGPVPVHCLVVRFAPPPVVLPAMTELVPAGTVPLLAMSGVFAGGVTGGGGGVSDTVGVTGLPIVPVAGADGVVLRLLRSTSARVKFQVQVSVVFAPEGGCHAYDDTTVLVLLTLIVVAPALSSM